MNAGYGTGSFSVIDDNGTILASGGVFEDFTTAAYKTGNANTVGVTNFNSNLVVYPNPVKNELTIKGDYTSVNIYDIFNKLVLTSESQKTINVSSLSNGAYFLNINTENAITVKKITITK